MNGTGLTAAACVLGTAVVLQAQQTDTRSRTQGQQQTDRQRDPQQRNDRPNRERQGTQQNEREQQPQRSSMRSTTEQRIAGLTPSPEIGGARPTEMVLVTSTASISSNPRSFYGVPVSVHASVGEYYDAHSFTLDQDAWWQFGDPVLVLVPSPADSSRALRKDDFVTVVGTVRPFFRTEVERDYDWFDFDALPDLQIDIEGRPMIVAEIARTSDGAVITQSDREVTRVLVAEPGDIAETPGRFYGRSVAVRQEVENVWSPRAFTLDEDRWFAGPDLLVLNPRPMPLAGSFEDYDDETLTVYGTVRPFIRTEFEQDYDWFDPAEFDRAQLDGWERRPVVIASSILTDERLDLVRFTPESALDRTEARLQARAQRWPDMAASNRSSSKGPGGQVDQAQRGQERERDQDTRRNQDPDRPVATAGDRGPRAGAQPITHIGGLLEREPDHLFGTQVRIDRIPVARVIDDRTFALGEGQDRQIIARLGEGSGPDITAGDTVRVEGVVARPGNDSRLGDRPFYVYARIVAPAR